MGGVLRRWEGQSGSEVTTPGPEPPLLAPTAGRHTHWGLNPWEMTPGPNARFEGSEGNRSISSLRRDRALWHSCWVYVFTGHFQCQSRLAVSSAKFSQLQSVSSTISSVHTVQKRPSRVIYSCVEIIQRSWGLVWGKRLPCMWLSLGLSSKPGKPCCGKHEAGSTLPPSPSLLL